MWRRTPKERRSAERLQVNEIVRLRSEDLLLGLGRLRDVSLGGAYLETPRRAQKRKRLLIRLTSLDTTLEPGSWLEARMTRRDRRGIGLRWSSFAPPAVLDLLQWQRSAGGMSPAVTAEPDHTAR